MASSDRYRNFATVFYPESCSFEDMRNFLSDLHVSCFISPLHDKDINPTGEPKKPHWHVMFMFEGKKSREQVADLLNGSGAVGIEIVNSQRGYARYLCHLDNPEKVQYNIDQVTALSGADYDDSIGLPVDTVKACRDMIEFCNDNCVLSFDVLVDYSIACRPDWFRVLKQSSTLFIKEYLKSKAWRIKKEKEDAESS